MNISEMFENYLLSNTPRSPSRWGRGWLSRPRIVLPYQTFGLELRLDPEAKARASGSERETGRVRASEIFPVSELRLAGIYHIPASRSERNIEMRVNRK